MFVLLVVAIISSSFSKDAILIKMIELINCTAAVTSNIFFKMHKCRRKNNLFMLKKLEITVLITIFWNRISNIGILTQAN